MEYSFYQGGKLAIVHLTGLSKDALHIYVGLVIFLVAACLVRRRAVSLIPIAVVVAIAVLGEVLDARDDLMEFGRWHVTASLRDVANTVFWPAILWLLLKLRVLSIPERRQP